MGNQFGLRGFAGDKSNVVLIICDDLNDYITGIPGQKGHPQSLTPNVEKLAKSGVQDKPAEGAGDLVQRIKARTDCPMALGFRIGTSDQAMLPLLGKAEKGTWADGHVIWFST